MLNRLSLFFNVTVVVILIHVNLYHRTYRDFRMTQYEEFMYLICNCCTSRNDSLIVSGEFVLFPFNKIVKRYLKR